MLTVEQRLRKAIMVRDAYETFSPFLEDAMEVLGFSTTWMQQDIAEFMEEIGNSMVQAQRGEAKSTIACIYAVYRIVKNPQMRVLLISASTAKANENAQLIYGLITRWDMLDYLRPDRTAGDRAAVGSFDVHWSLKGINKSASCTCMGITSSLQGFRADLLVADDVETNRNSLTAAQREILLNLTKEFTSIVADSSGQVLYLGTPQTKDSIYNTLPLRGFRVRIWPGRFPQDEDTLKYGDLLAPSIVERMQILGSRCLTGGGLSGKRGWPTDPDRMPEHELQAKELDQGPETFELQFMLNTNLSDAMRQQLRLRDLVFLDCSSTRAPEQVEWSPSPSLKVLVPEGFPIQSPDFFYTAAQSSTFADIQNITMFLDPAGTGGDELAYAIGGVVPPYLHCTAVGGLQGGVSEDNLAKLVDLVHEYKVTTLLVEKNMGHGTVLYVIQNYFNSIVDGKPRVQGCALIEKYSTKQKEVRIIEALRPVMQRHRLVMHLNTIQTDWQSIQQYPLHSRAVRSCFMQMQDITTDRGCLSKDDRIDSLAGLVEHLGTFLLQDEETASEQRSKAAANEFIQNPMGRQDLQSNAASGLQRRSKRHHYLERRRR